MYFSGHGYSFSSVTISVTRKEGYNMSRRKRITPYEQAIRYLSQVEYIDMMIGEKQDMIDSMKEIERLNEEQKQLQKNYNKSMGR